METTNLKKALEEIAEKYKQKLKAQSKIDKTYATGKFSNSFKSKVDGKSIEIYSDVDYAGAVDGGSKPASLSGKVSQAKFSAIEEWAKAKRLRPISKLKGGYKFRRMNTDKRSGFRSMVFAIANSIANKGTIKRYNYEGTIKRYNYEGSKIFERVFDSMRKKIGGEISEAFAIDLRNELIKITKK